MKLVFFVLSAFLVWEANVQGAYGFGFDPRSYDAQMGKIITCEAVKRSGHRAEAGSGNAPVAVEHEERVPIQLRTWFFLPFLPSFLPTLVIIVRKEKNGELTFAPAFNLICLSYRLR